ncbi:MAG: hypothetical protein D6692_14080 [Planctomycetota bacterium]|nr:MAG: hypothetical protein D6692_14080 [Planctomycetota bacterium]
MLNHHRRAVSPAWLACTLSVCAGTVLAAQDNTTATARRAEIRWSNGIVDRIAPHAASEVRASLEALGARADARRVIVTLSEAVTPEKRAALEAAGVRLLSPLGGTSYFASLLPTLDAAAAVGMGIDQASAIDVNRKMHADIAGGLVRSWTVVGPTPEKLRSQLESGAVTINEFRAAQADPLVAVIAAFHKDAAASREAGRLAVGLGGEIRSVIRSVNAVVMHLPVSRLRDLAADDSVMWIEPPLPALTELNAENRVLTGVNTVNAAPYGLDGSGVTVLVYDGGRMFQHGDFAGRLTIGASDTSSTSNHATHVGGTVGGSGAGNINHRGMAPGVQIVSYGFEQAGGLQQGFLYTDPGDIEADYGQAINTYGADISNNSIGTNTEPNGYPCEWQGNYGITSALIDEIARGSFGNPFRIVWANGNERQGSRCDVEGYGDFYSTAPPAGAKNHIAVGSVDSNTDLTSSFSSWGPVDDGRIKPDISAPGCQTDGDGGVTSTSSSGGYTTMCGTSMASPTVTGIASLILEQYRLSFPDRPDPRNSTLKALLANTAVDRGNPGPDYQYGYGSVRADAAVDAVIGENVIEAEVGQGQVYTFVVIVGADDPQLKVTIAWDDPSGTPNVNPVLVNDLDLRVIDPNGGVHLPWTLNPSNPNANAVRNVRDGVNNIEQVFIENAAPGGYLVEVRGFNIAGGGTQGFGAASNGFLVNCASAGRVTLGSSLLPCSGDLEVSVVDCDLNTSDSVVDTVQVQVVSSSDPSGFVMTLTEVAPEAATFTASFSYSSAGRADLFVQPGDTVTVTYVDSDDGAGGTNVAVSQSVMVDCTAPEVLSATATNIEPRSATAEITLDEPSSVVVRYGTSLGNLTGSASNAALQTSHSVNMSGLTDNTAYVFVVDATDAAGNTVTDNNNGQGYGFVTPEVPDFFTEQFTSGIDLNNKRIMFTPSANNDEYIACVESLDGAFPTDPAGGTNISLSDDDNEPITITGGNSVQLYGVSYTTIYVGSNGYITFGAGDTDYTEDLVDHFDMPRVSALFDDLNPSVGGTVSRKQLADRIAITWQGVPQYANSDSNNFQVELFFDGRISISHRQVSSGDAIVGLSGGGGLDVDYFPSDLSSYSDCNACPADLAEPFGVLNVFDIQAYIGLYNAQDPFADLAAPFGTFNIFDLQAYINLYNAGCP